MKRLQLVFKRRAKPRGGCNLRWRGQLVTGGGAIIGIEIKEVYFRYLLARKQKCRNKRNSIPLFGAFFMVEAEKDKDKGNPFPLFFQNCGFEQNSGNGFPLFSGYGLKASNPFWCGREAFLLFDMARKFPFMHMAGKPSCKPAGRGTGLMRNPG